MGKVFKNSTWYFFMCRQYSLLATESLSSAFSSHFFLMLIPSQDQLDLHKLKQLMKFAKFVA